MVVWRAALAWLIPEWAVPLSIVFRRRIKNLTRHAKIFESYPYAALSLPGRDWASWPAVFGGIKDRPEVNDPPEQDEPEEASKHEHDDGNEETALEQLSQAGDEKAAQGGEHVTG